MGTELFPSPPGGTRINIVEQHLPSTAAACTCAAFFPILAHCSGMEGKNRRRCFLGPSNRDASCIIRNRNPRRDLTRPIRNWAEETKYEKYITFPQAALRLAVGSALVTSCFLSHLSPPVPRGISSPAFLGPHPTEQRH